MDQANISGGSADRRGVKSVDDFLKHFGVKGMKWGRHKKSAPIAEDAARKMDVKSKVKKNGVKNVSNKDLQDAINRMNLEQQFKRLSTNERPVVTRFIASTLQEIGKREVQAQIAKKATQLITKVA